MTDRVEIRQGDTGSEGPDDRSINPDEFVVEGLQESEDLEPKVEEQPQERPEWLPEKFSSPEDLSKAYTELESKMSSDTTEDSADESEGSEDDGYYESMTNESVAPYSEEFNKSGALSDESYTEIESKFGVSKEMAEAYVAGQQAIQQNMMNEIFAGVGGSENYAEMMRWSNRTLAAEEVSAFDKTINEGNMDNIKLAVSGVWARFQQERGNRSGLIQGQSPSNSSGAFQSIAELTEAMKDPRYQKDPAYRMEIQNRLDVSNIM